MRLRFMVGASLATLLFIHAPLDAQEGFRIGLGYDSDERPRVRLAVMRDAGDTERVIRSIVERDLLQTGRIALVAPGDRDFGWNVELTWEPRSRALSARLSQDVGGGSVDRFRVVLPVAADESRLGVHALADALTERITGSPGTAATRIAFAGGPRGRRAVYLVDADGEGLRRLTTPETLVLSPTWSSDGRRIYFTAIRNNRSVLIEYTLATRKERVIASGDGTNTGRTESDDGRVFAYANSATGRSSIAVVMQGDTSRIGGRYEDALSPSLAPNGRALAYVSNRTGEPLLYVRDIATGTERRPAPFTGDEHTYQQAPDWSPDGRRLAFHARRGSGMSIGVVSPPSPLVRWVRDDGRSEDPSWAADGRHLVYRSPVGGGTLFIVDTEGGPARRLAGEAAATPDWSPRLLRVARERNP